MTIKRGSEPSGSGPLFQILFQILIKIFFLNIFSNIYSDTSVPVAAAGSVHSLSSAGSPHPVFRISAISFSAFGGSAPSGSPAFIRTIRINGSSRAAAGPRALFITGTGQGAVVLRYAVARRLLGPACFEPALPVHLVKIAGGEEKDTEQEGHRQQDRDQEKDVQIDRSVCSRVDKMEEEGADAVDLFGNSLAAGCSAAFAGRKVGRNSPRSSCGGGFCGSDAGVCNVRRKQDIDGSEFIIIEGVMDTAQDSVFTPAGCL